jgi:cardiolipin synthase A/B
VMVRDAPFANQLHAALLNLEVQGGRVIDPNTWRKRGWMIRALDWMSYGVLRAIVGLFGARGARW